MLQKSQCEEEKAGVFVQNGVSIWSITSFFLAGRMLFLLVNKRCAYPGTELFEFFEEMQQDFLNTKKIEWDKQSIMFWGYNTVRWTETTC